MSEVLRVAYVFGVNCYDKINPLKKAVDDACNLGKFLEYELPEGYRFNVRSILNPEAKVFEECLKSLEHEMTDAEQKLPKGAHNLVLIYFAGHGVTVGEDSRLLCCDAPESAIDNPKSSTGFILLDRITNLADSLKKTEFVVWIDACRSIPGGRGGVTFDCDVFRGKNRDVRSCWSVNANSAGRVVLTSCSRGESASDSGVYMQETLDFMRDCLRNGTGLQFGPLVIKSIKERLRANNRNQTPTCSCERCENGEFVLVPSGVHSDWHAASPATGVNEPSETEPVASRESSFKAGLKDVVGFLVDMVKGAVVIMAVLFMLLVGIVIMSPRDHGEEPAAIDKKNDVTATVVVENSNKPTDDLSDDETTNPSSTSGSDQNGDSTGEGDADSSFENAGEDSLNSEENVGSEGTGTDGPAGEKPTDENKVITDADPVGDDEVVETPPVVVVNPPVVDLWGDDPNRKAGTLRTLMYRCAGKQTICSLEFSWIPGGEFKMGSPLNESGRFGGQNGLEDDETQHSVTLTHGYWLLTTPITQRTYEAVMGQNPSCFIDPDFPVEGVSYSSCVKFMERLKEVVTTFEEGLPPDFSFRLPTDAEWERACRAGTDTAYWWGDVFDKSKANCNNDRLTSVYKYNPNPWGIWDMHGNAYEWTSDFYVERLADNSVDPKGPDYGKYHVVRGGNFGSNPRYARSACRCYPGNGRSEKDYHIGFRIILVPGSDN